MKKVLLIFGTRPEAIKLAPVVLEMRKQGELTPVVAVTAQHRHLLDQVLSLFNIVPDYDLDIMDMNQTLADINIRALRGLTKIIEREKPDMVMVHGDTTTTFAGALAAFYNRIPVAHVEAGLRSKHKYEPFPEEINRVLTSILTDLHLAPTSIARSNLLKEGIADEQIVVTGNSVIDALIAGLEVVGSQKYVPDTPTFQQNEYILLEVHRRENWGLPMREIFLGVRDFVIKNSKIGVIFPVHPNPLIKELAQEIFNDLQQVKLIEPTGYLEFIRIMKDSRLIITDSGGIQEEASYLNKQVILVRRVTERPEGVEKGFISISGIDREKITESIEKAYNISYDNARLATSNIYGDGKASSRIIASILWYFGKNPIKPVNYLSEGGSESD